MSHILGSIDPLLLKPVLVRKAPIMDTTLLNLLQVKPSVPFIRAVNSENTTLDHQSNQINHLDYSTHDRVKTEVAAL